MSISKNASSQELVYLAKQYSKRELPVPGWAVEALADRLQTAINTKPDLEQTIMEIAENLYFVVLEVTGTEVNYIEEDPDNEGQTRNTPDGEQLYWAIEETLKNRLGV